MIRSLATPMLAMLLLLVPSSAVTQNAAIDTIRTDAGFRQAAAKDFSAYEMGLSTHCGSVDPAWGLAKAKVYGQPALGAGGGIINATWVETVPGTACGVSRRYRVLVAIRGGKANVASLLPGDSFASPQLEADAQRSMANAAQPFLPKGLTCAVDVLDTHIAGAVPTATNQAWSEVWTVAECGKRLNVPVQFVPDVVGERTTIRVDSKAVTVVP